MHDLAPATGVACTARASVASSRRFRETASRRRPAKAHATRVTVHLAQRKTNAFSFFEREVRGNAASGFVQRYPRRKPEAQLRGGEERAVFAQRDLMRIPRKIESRAAVEPKAGCAAHPGDPAQQLGLAFPAAAPTGMKSMISAAPAGARKRVTSTFVSGQ